MSDISVGVKKIYQLAKERKDILESQREKLWEDIYLVCKSIKKEDNYFVIHEYNKYSDITIICKKSKKSSEDIANALSSKNIKFITIHRYLRDREHIISIDGKKVIFLYENDVNQIQTPNANIESENIRAYGFKILYMLRHLYGPNVLLNISNKNLKDDHVIYLNSILQLFKQISKKKELQSTENISGGRHKFTKASKFIVKRNNSNEGVNEFIQKYISDINDSRSAVILKNDRCSIIVSNDMWNVVKGLKDKLNKKFNKERKGDRFYYEISQNFIHNDFRLKRISVVDRKTKKIILYVFNNLEYEAIPSFYNFIMHPSVELRYMLYNMCINLNTDMITSLDENILLAFQTFKKIVLEPVDINKIYYVGNWLEDKVEKIRLGGSMIRL